MKLVGVKGSGEDRGKGIECFQVIWIRGIHSANASQLTGPYATSGTEIKYLM